MSGIDDLVSTAKGAVQNISQLTLAIQSAFPRITGSFTLSAATVTVVPQPLAQSNSLVFPFASNTTGALIVSTNGLFQAIGSTVPGTSFTLSTQAGSATPGGTFHYFMITPS